MLKYTQFKNPTEKIWYADSGRMWNNSLQVAVETWQPQSSRGLKDGLTTGAFGAQVSWRHGTNVSNPRGNVAFFDGHAATIDPREVEYIEPSYGAMTPSDAAKFRRYWDPDGDGNIWTPRN
jgi:prepilin-type processing-associated H-X9-DG protein